jgi:tRNA-specific adenosine deaminase 1
MNQMTHSPESIARAALSMYASLPKTGKPQAHEVTTLAAILVTLPVRESNILGTTHPLVITIATGTKSLPGFKRAQDGSAVHDCHAEVLARRALLRWVYDELEASDGFDASESLSNLNSCTLRSLVIYKEKGKAGLRAGLRAGVQLHLFVSRLPCGDAAIVEPLESRSIQSTAKRLRTGAKPSIHGLPTACDVESYMKPQVLGVVRRKPGKGEATLSVSCSDKIAKWMLLGVQGSMLSNVFKTRIYLHSITVALAASAPHSVETATHNALQRAFVQRITPLKRRLLDSTGLPDIDESMVSVVRVADEELESLRLGVSDDSSKVVYCGTSLVWWAPPSWQWRVKAAKYGGGGPCISASGMVGDSTDEGPGVKGRLQVPILRGGQSEALTGAFGCRAGRPRAGGDPVPLPSRSLLCRAALARRYLTVCCSSMTSLTKDAAEKLTYRSLKTGNTSCNTYAADWEAVRARPSPFVGWIDKGNDDGEFYVESDEFE